MILKFLLIIFILIFSVENATCAIPESLPENTLIYTFNEEFEHLQDTWRRYNQIQNLNRAYYVSLFIISGIYLLAEITTGYHSSPILYWILHTLIFYENLPLIQDNDLLLSAEWICYIGQTTALIAYIFD